MAAVTASPSGYPASPSGNPASPEGPAEMFSGADRPQDQGACLFWTEVAGRPGDVTFRGSAGAACESQNP